MAPRIAIPVPTSTDTAYNNLNWPAYADAVLACGGDPVRVELGASPRELTDLSYSCQAILLPGSPADVNPAKYGQVRVEQTAYTDLPRENVDELLLQDAHNLFKPIFGVCFGMQMLNVWRSGTLVQDLAPLPVNHSAARGVAVAHTVAVAQGTLLADLMLAIDPTAPLRSLPVNSSHHQAVGILGDGLIAGLEAILTGLSNRLRAGRLCPTCTPALPRRIFLVTLCLVCNGIRRGISLRTHSQGRFSLDFLRRHGPGLLVL